MFCHKVQITNLNKWSSVKVMIRLQNKLINFDKSDGKSNQLLIEAKKGSFWHWRRTYVMKNEEGRIYTIRLNIFERIYGNLVGCGIENFFKKVFSNKKIIGFASEKEIKILMYNTSKSIPLNERKNSQSPLDEIYQQIESEATLWRGNREINLQTPNPFLNGPLERKEWWGRFAQYVGSTGLNTLLEKVTQEKKGVALDIGCGKSNSAIYLLNKGWKVICLDSSQEALDVMHKNASQINQKWLKTNQLELVCNSVEEYQWPIKVDLVLASSALPYINPQKLKAVMEKIYKNLNSGCHFIGNFFASKYVGSAMDLTREMGAWFVEDKDSVGYLLAGQGYEVIECEGGGAQNPHSVVFIGKKSTV